jgi:hypothetical protein
MPLATPARPAAPSTAALLVLLTLLGATAMPAAAAGPTRVAVLPSGMGRAAAVAALVEVELAARDDLAVVERAQVDKAIREQAVAEALGPQGAGRRTALGRVLGADLLVLTSARDRPVPAVDVVVCETGMGVRLCAEPVVLSADAGADAAAVGRLVAAAAGRRTAGAGHQRVVAVPPLLNRDLTHEADHLQAAYARLAERALLGRPGVWVVELAEAEAIAREVALAGGQGVRRPPPLYLVGDFRHEGRGDARRVTIEFAARQGEREVARARRADLVPADSPAAVTSAVGELLAAAAGEPPPAAGTNAGAEANAGAGASLAGGGGPAAEAVQLADRAKLFLRVGHWAEAASLAEASLLLDPAQPKLHRDALAAIAGSLPSPRNPAIRTPRPADPRQALSRYRRGLEHLESYARTEPLVQQQEQSLLGTLFEALEELDPRGPRADPRRRPATRQAVEDDLVAAREETRVVLERVLARKAGERAADEAVLLLGYPLLGVTPESRRDAVRLSLLADFTYLTAGGGDAARRVAQSLVVMANRPTDAGHGDPASIAFFSALRGDASRPAAIREAAGVWVRVHERARDERAAAATRPAARPAVPTPDADPQVTFAKLDLGPAGVPVAWVAAGADLDVVAAGVPSRAFAVRPGGQVTPLTPRGASLRDLRDVWFDGRYVWGVAGPPRGVADAVRRLVAFDPTGGPAVEFGPADGLPRGEDYAVAPLGPGRACAVGYFGRAWCAVLSVEASGRKSARMVREFQEVPDRDSKTAWESPDAAFVPSVVLPLVDPANPAGGFRRVVVGRGGLGSPSLWDHPVRIDLDTGRTDVVREGCSFLARANIAGDGSAAYAFDYGPAVNKVTRVGFADEVKASARVVGAPTLSNVGFVFAGGRFHVVGDDRRGASYWAVADRYDGPYRPLRIAWPEPKAMRPYLAASNLHGTVMLTKTAAYQVAFPLGLTEGEGR